jgi:hypothetical protein
MTEARRPILHLKLGAVTRPVEPEAPAKPAAWSKPKPDPFTAQRARAPTPRPAPPPAAPAPAWKCRPCGSAFDVPPEAGDADAIRCPSCNAKLGLAGDFRSDPPNLDKLRARQAKR